jgi:glycosyltransferase involved in cell wall biosynthesis
MNGINEPSTASHLLASADTASNAPIASIVIPAYNEQDGIARTVESVLESIHAAGVKADVVIANNASTDRTRPILESYGGLIHLIDVPQKGVSHARQAGLNASKTDHAVLTTDADAVVPKHWVEEHLRALDAPHVVLAVGGAEFDRVHRLYTTLLAVRQLARVITDPLRSSKAKLLRSVHGVNMSFLKQPALTTGGYEPGIDYGEDAVLAKKLLAHGDLALIKSKDAVVTTSGRRFQSARTIIKRAGQNFLNTAASMVSDRRVATHFEDIR